MKYNVQLNVYEGPLDLLYDMITKQKIDIKDISIVDMTKQYLEYISMLEKMDMDITSEFIAMATKLLEIKSRYLLYKQKDNTEELDPRLELVEKLEEYKKYKLATEDIKGNINYIDELFYRRKEEIIIDEKLELEDISIEAIKKILPLILKVKEVEEQSNDENLNKIIKGKIIAVEDKIAYIRDILQHKEKIGFNNIVNTYTKDEVIATFLSLLELIKSKEIIVVQDEFFEDIAIKRA